MPDRWEKAHGLDWRKANAKGDPDRDGFSNISASSASASTPARPTPHACSALQIALGATDPSECGSVDVPSAPQLAPRIRPTRLRSSHTPNPNPST